MLVERVDAYLSKLAADRPPPSRIGAWNVGRCPRQLWFQTHGTVGEPLEPRSLRTFETGDAVEDRYTAYGSAAGIGLIRTDESRDTVAETLRQFARNDADKERISGVRSDFHFQVPDPIGNRPIPLVTKHASSPSAPFAPGLVIPCELKSMSDFAYERACRGELDDSYVAQAECYARAYGSDYALFWCVRKETDHHCEVLLARSDERWAWIRQNIALALGKEPPARPYELVSKCAGCEGRGETKHSPPRRHEPCNGSGLNPDGAVLPQWPCGFCSVKAACWEPKKLEIFVRDGKPFWRMRAS